MIVVDVQNDSCPGDALAVPEGDTVVPIINRLMQADYFDLIVATQNWRPANHLSFAPQHGKSPGEIIELNGAPQGL